MGLLKAWWLVVWVVAGEDCYDQLDRFDTPGTCLRLITTTGLKCNVDFLPGGGDPLQSKCDKTCGICSVPTN